MTRRQQYEALAAWAESAEGPDQEKDAEFWLLAKPGVTRKQWSYIHTASGKECHVDETRDETGRLITVPAYTSCLTTLTAVIGEVLPEMEWLVRLDDGAGALANLYPKKADIIAESDTFPVFAKTPALALFASLCLALADRCGDA